MKARQDCSFLSLIEQGRLARLASELERMYHDAGQRMEKYLVSLEQLYPHHQNISYQWFAGKERMNLYTNVARHLYKRTESGEFTGRTYLPSVPEIMRTYQVSKSTASSAIALLCDIGLIITLDKRGIMLRESESWQPARLDSSVINSHLLLFLDALQVLSLCSKRLSLAAAVSLVPHSETAILQKWETAENHESASHIVWLLLDYLKQYTPHNCLRNILNQFDDILIWGHYLARPEYEKCGFLKYEQEISRQFAHLLTAWKDGTPEECSGYIEKIFQSAYLLSKARIQPKV